MSLVPIIFFACFVIILITIQYISSKNVLYHFSNKSPAFADRIIEEKKNVTVKTFQMNTKSWNFRFNKSDLLFLADGLIMLGYYQFFGIKIYRSCIILTNNIEFYKTIYPTSIVHSPKTLNLNSFNNDVYIELEFKQLLVATVEIRVKGLSEDEKRLISLNKNRT